MGVLFDIYILFAWLGTRTEHLKFGENKTLMSFLLFGILCLCVVFSYIGGPLSALMTLLALLSFGLSFFLAPIIALVGFVGYFYGLSEWMSDFFHFPAKGYLRCPKEASLFQWCLVVLWLYLRIDSFCFVFL